VEGKKPALKTRADAEAVLSALQGVAFKIASVTPKERRQKPPAPFTTSTLQQAASSHLKLAPEMTMKLAQQLYEMGDITYMRTDSPAVSPEGVQMAAKTISNLYGEKYLGSTKHAAKSGAQEAHECIRPTDSETSPDAMALNLSDNPGAAKLYELIYRRFLASQMAEAVYNEVLATVAGGEAVFSAKGSQLAFDGFLRAYDFGEEKEVEKRADSDEDDEPANKQLPPLTVNESAHAKSISPHQHFTKPPSPYSEALLVKALEQNGVGRPSTYAQTIATLKARGYVELVKRQLKTTPLGQQVLRVLLDKLPGLFDVDFTAQMETALDDIAAGKREERAYLKGFWQQVAPLFGEKIVQASTAPKATKSAEPSSSPKKPSAPRKPAQLYPELGVCPQCGKPLAQRSGKYGPFVGCSGYPECKYIRK